MFSFHWPWIFLLLPLPWVVQRFMSLAKNHDTAALTVPFFSTLMKIQQTFAEKVKPLTRQKNIAIFIWLLLIIAGAGPSWLGEPINLSREGRDIMLAVDLSGSMQIADMSLNGMPASRLDVTKVVAQQFIKRRTGDRIGLILFGSRAYIQTPLTFDRGTVSHMLEDATIALAGPNTAIGDAIGLAIKHLSDHPSESRVVVLLTDGANNSGVLPPLQAVQIAKDSGIKIYTIGIGSDQPTVPGLLGEILQNPSSDLDTEALRKIAELTGGMFFHSKDTASLEQAYRNLDKLEPVQGDSTLVRASTLLYPWPLGFALLLSLSFVFPYLTFRRKS